MNIEDKAPLTGNYNRTDLRLVVVDMAQSPTPDGNQARTIAASELFAQLEQGREVIPFEALTSLSWNVANQPRVYLDLVTDLSHIVTKNAANGFYFELHARQPQSGGKKLTIDGVPVTINRTGNTLIIARYIGGVLDVHTDASAEAGKPILLDESVSQTVLEGEYAEVWAKFSGANEYVIERDGKPVPEATGAALLVKVADQTAGAYEVIAKNDHGETRSAAKFIKPGEAESVYLVTEPADASVPAGTEFTLTAVFAGTPPPAVKCVEVVNGQVAQTVGNTGTYKTTSLYTKQYQFVATNAYKVPVVIKPAVLAPDGITVVTPAVTELQKKTFTAASKVVTVTPIKQEQAAPTMPLVNNYDHLYDFTYASGITNVLMYEFTIDGGRSYTNCSRKPIPIPDKDFSRNLVGVRVKETLTHEASDTLYNDVVFIGTPLLQDIRQSNGTADNLLPVGNSGEDMFLWRQGSEQRGGLYWTNNFILTNKKASKESKVRIQQTVKIGYGDVRLGFKTNPINGGFDTQEACIIISPYGDISAEWKRADSSGFDFTGYGSLLNGDIFFLDHNLDGSFSPGFIRDNVEVLLPVANPQNLPIIYKDDLYVHLAGKENSTAGIFKPQTYNLSPL